MTTNLTINNLTKEQIIIAINRTIKKAKLRQDPEIRFPIERQFNELMFDLEHLLDDGMSSGRKEAK